MSSFEPRTFEGYDAPEPPTADAYVEDYYYRRPFRVIRLTALAIAAVVGFAAVAVGISLMVSKEHHYLWGILAILGGLILSILVYVLGEFLAMRLDKGEESVRQQAESTHTAEGQRRSSTDDRDERSVNQKLLAQYHDVTKRQASSSYRVSQIAMAIGFSMLVGGGYLVLRQADTKSAQILVGGLAAFGAAFSSYIGATFVKTYNKSLAQMNFYYAQPLVQSYILQAERISKSLSNQGKRDAVLAEIISQTLRGADVAAQLTRPAGETIARANRIRRAAKSPSPNGSSRSDGAVEPSGT